MTLQQLEYIVALDKTRHFVRAAEMCGVTQPTLSAMIQKLEDELDCRIFDRSSHPIENARAVFDDDGNILLYEGTVEDITERKLYQARIEQ